MKMNIPTSIDGNIKAKLHIVTSKIGAEILKSLLRKNPQFLNELTRDLSKTKLGSRRSIHKYLTNLEDIGLIESEMVLLIPPNVDTKRWVRKYEIVKEHKKWIEPLVNPKAKF